MGASHRLVIEKKIYSGIDIGATFFQNAHESGMFARYNHDDLRIVMPDYLTDILMRHYSPHQQDERRQLDKDGYFKFMGIKMFPGYEEKVIIYHKDYPLYKKQDMYHEFDLSLLVS